MRRVGIVGDGLTGLMAAIGAASAGAEVVLFGRQEPLGGLSAPLDEEWGFDRAPIAWRKGALSALLARMKVRMRCRHIPWNAMAVIRGDVRLTLPHTRGLFRRASGPLAAALAAARSGDLEDEDARDMASLLGLLWTLDPTPSPEAVRQLGRHAAVPVDGWHGASGRLIAGCLQSDVSFHCEGAVTGFRESAEGRIDGIRRKGRVMPVDAVVIAHAEVHRTVHARYLGLSGDFMRPHSVLWDVDREVFALDLGRWLPERLPAAHRATGGLVHCFAFGEAVTASDRIEAFLDVQCPGWRGALEFDHEDATLRLPRHHGAADEGNRLHADPESALEVGRRAAQL